MMGWPVPLMPWIPALSSWPLGAVRHHVAFSVHLEGPLLVFREGSAVGGGACGPGAGQGGKRSI